MGLLPKGPLDVLSRAEQAIDNAESAVGRAESTMTEVDRKLAEVGTMMSDAVALMRQTDATVDELKQAVLAVVTQLQNLVTTLDRRRTDGVAI
ncbi:hypothetical protein [Nocardia transvalensis]|uniref:hypothetical protein n=1 Tax=Nocardia transvalensis TaxID=37333 RepID=UPI001893D165|nr:hypothetical protein [Nocardia transvalensis]MBF6333048.1 hypothetical protein [Nocardia transvalensis]